MRRVALVSAVVALVVSGCSIRLGVHMHDPLVRKNAHRHQAAPAHPGKANGALAVLVEPAAGIAKIYRLIGSARSSIDLTMYELRDTTAEAGLAAAAARGVDVRVILDRHLERSRNTATYDYLRAHHVHVTWAPAGTTYHQKTLTVDGRTSVIMTLNMVSEDYAGTRDFAVIDTSASDIRAIVKTLNADFSHRAITPPDGADLVWSPTNSESSILAVIDAATRTLTVENEEMARSSIITALQKAAGRGVDVKVVMTADSEWDRAFGELVRAGVHVHLFRDSSRVLYIHAKAAVADAGRKDQQVFVGSENFSTASLTYNRELGVRTANAAVVSAISATLAGDYASATAYSPGG
jgi:phosphatidylserine/phosphatidylglycerophosphate/cardiolipin synthase-like enzyme